MLSTITALSPLKLKSPGTLHCGLFDLQLFGLCLFLGGFLCRLLEPCTLTPHFCLFMYFTTSLGFFFLLYVLIHGDGKTTLYYFTITDRNGVWIVSPDLTWGDAFQVHNHWSLCILYSNCLCYHLHILVPVGIKV